VALNAIVEFFNKPNLSSGNRFA
ncbi:hypothetical protein RPL81_13565, partial [Salmonella enterica]|nr:hypothetical protein [Salmonella enterica]